MPMLRNINPLGDIDVPLIGRQGDNGDYADPDDNGYEARTGVTGIGCLERGEEFTVTDEQAAILLEQETNFEPVDDAAKAVLADLVEEAQKRAQFRQAVTELAAAIPDPADDDDDDEIGDAK